MERPLLRQPSSRRSLLAAATLPWALPGVSPARAASPFGLAYSWPTNAGPLDPRGYGPNQMFAQAMIYEPLVRYAEGGVIQPCLATSWQLEEDGRAWVFALRQGVRFSDGTVFDAAAVVANVAAVVAHRDRHAWLDLVAQIESAEAIDAGTVRLKLAHPYDPALFELALIRPLRFASPAVLKPDGGVTAPIGTGPWVLSESRRGERDVFTRNPGYWGERPALERVVVKMVADANTRALALETGEIDLVYGTDQLDADTFRRFAADPRFATAISAPVATRMMAVNSGRFPTDDPVVRLAIQHGIDRAALVKHVLQETEPAAHTLFADNVPYADIGLVPFGFDRAKAAKALEDAGWVLPPGGRVRMKGGRPLALDLAFIGGDALQKALAEAVQGDLARIGIAARLLGEAAGSHDGRQRSGEFGMIFADSWGAPYDPHAYLGSMRQPAHADYQAQIGLPMKAEIDFRISAVLVSTDEAVRRAEYRWLLTTLHEQAVYLPISFVTNKAVYRKDAYDIPFGATRDEIPFDRIHRL
jgi:nickel transport system substrate-binding protein